MASRSSRVAVAPAGRVINPGNPTGGVIERETLKAVLGKAKVTMFGGSPADGFRNTMALFAVGLFLLYYASSNFFSIAMPVWLAMACISSRSVRSK